VQVEVAERYWMRISRTGPGDNQERGRQ
jgi:hypothetical protein